MPKFASTITYIRLTVQKKCILFHLRNQLEKQFGIISKESSGYELLSSRLVTPWDIEHLPLEFVEAISNAYSLMRQKFIGGEQKLSYNDLIQYSEELLSNSYLNKRAKLAAFHKKLLIMKNEFLSKKNSLEFLINKILLDLSLIKKEPLLTATTELYADTIASIYNNPKKFQNDFSYFEERRSLIVENYQKAFGVDKAPIYSSNVGFLSASSPSSPMPCSEISPQPISFSANPNRATLSERKPKASPSCEIVGRENVSNLVENIKIFISTIIEKIDAGKQKKMVDHRDQEITPQKLLNVMKKFIQRIDPELPEPPKLTEEEVLFFVEEKGPLHTFYKANKIVLYELIPEMYADATDDGTYSFLS